MKKRKTFRIGFAVIIVASLLTGCTNSNSSGAGATNSGGENSDSQENKETVSLTFMGWEASPLETQAVKDGIAEFETQYPHVKVNYTPGLAGSEYNAKLISSIAAGSLPDVMFVATESYRELVKKGALHEITAQFNEEYPLDDFIASSQTIMDVDGKIFGLSSCTVSPILYYNKDLFDAANIEYPSSDPGEAMTIDEFRDLAKQLTTEDVYGVYGLESVADTLNAQLLSNGGSRYSDDYMESTMNSPENKEVFETIKAIRVEDGTAPDATTLDSVGMTSKQMLQTGKVAMLIDGSWALQELAASGMNVGLAPLPAYKEVLTTGQAHLHCISNTSDYKDEAWEFLKFLSGMDYQGELVSQGLWMPNRVSMYEEEAVAQWYDENVHGENFKEMLDYFKNAIVDPGALQKSTKARDIIAEETDLYFKQDADLDKMLQNIDTRINTAILESEGS